MKFGAASSGIKREKDDSDEEVTIIPQSQLRPDQLKSIKPDPESPALQQSFKLEGGNHHRGPHYRHREREGRWRSRSRSPRRQNNDKLRSKDAHYIKKERQEDNYHSAKVKSEPIEVNRKSFGSAAALGKLTTVFTSHV